MDMRVVPVGMLYVSSTVSRLDMEGRYDVRITIM